MFFLHYFILFVLFLFYLYKFSKDKPKGFPPGPLRLPIWGSYWFMLKENYKFSHHSFIALAKKYKTEILGVFLGSYPTVVVFSHKLCKEMLTRDEFIGRPDTILTRARAFNKKLGIFFVEGLFWKEQRRFSLRHMRDFGFGRRSEIVENILDEEIRKIMEIISNEPNESTEDICTKKGEILFPDIFYAPFLNTIFWVMASTRFEHKFLRKIGRHLIESQRSTDATGCAVTFTPWLRHIAPGFFGYTGNVRNIEIVQETLNKIVEDHRKTFSKDLCRDFIDVYLVELKEIEENTESTSFSYDQLLIIFLDYMFPSAIALSHTLNFYFAQLLNNPGIQEKIQQEIDTVVGRGRLPTLDDRQHLPYTEASIRETIRINPINPLLLPRVCLEDTELGGYLIPKNTIMFACVESAHMDETVWENPRKFSPERWLDPEGKLIKRDETLGFGAGKRLCAGETFGRQNMFLMAASLLQNFTFSPCGNAPDLNKQIPGANVSLPNYRMKVTVR